MREFFLDVRLNYTFEILYLKTTARLTHFMIYDLIPGNEYQFQVFAVNECGKSAAVETDFVKLEKLNLDLKFKKFSPLDVRKAPKFLTPLNGRMMILNYESTLSVALEGKSPNKNSRSNAENFISTMLIGIKFQLIHRLTYDANNSC